MSELIGNPNNLSLEEYVEQLQIRLAETEEILRAIRNGEIDALMVEGNTGEQIFTLKGADALYRLFVEEMMQGAITVNTQGLILYCNRRFSQFLRRPQEQIIGQKDNMPMAGCLMPNCRKLC